MGDKVEKQETVEEKNTVKDKEEAKVEQQKKEGNSGKNNKKDSLIQEAAETIEKKNSEIESLSEEVSELKDKLLRQHAEMENFRKRSRKQQEDQNRRTIANIAGDVIQVNDDLLRAIDAASTVEGEKSDAYKSFIEGVGMISRQLEGVLERYGVVEIDAEGIGFDPTFHEAVEIEVTPDVNTETVTFVHQKGFRLEDMVVRSAKVKVSKPAPKEKGTQDTGSADSNAESPDTDEKVSG